MSNFSFQETQHGQDISRVPNSCKLYKYLSALICFQPHTNTLCKYHNFSYGQENLNEHQIQERGTIIILLSISPNFHHLYLNSFTKFKTEHKQLSYKCLGQHGKVIRPWAIKPALLSWKMFQAGWHKRTHGPQMQSGLNLHHSPAT